MCSRPPEPTTSTVSDDVSGMSKGLSELLRFLGNKKLGPRCSRLTQLLAGDLTLIQCDGGQAEGPEIVEWNSSLFFFAFEYRQDACAAFRSNATCRCARLEELFVVRGAGE